MTRYSERERDFPYMGWIKARPCRLRGVDGAGECEGIVEAAHAGAIGDRAMSHRNGSDAQVIPLCTCHHGQLDRRDRGYFAGWPVLEVRAWALAAIADERDRYERQLAGWAALPF